MATDARRSHRAIATRGLVVVLVGLANAVMLHGSLTDEAAAVCGPASFVATAPLSVARASSATALLADGRVLFAGGDDFSVSAELYDSSSGNFAETGSLNAPRCYGCASARLADGRVLVVGGWDGATDDSTAPPRPTALSSAEVYDPALGTFSAVGNMSVGRLDPTATVLTDGRVLIAGGHDGSTPHRLLELFDPNMGTFTPAGAMSVPGVATATLLNDGRVLFVGGVADGGEYLAAAEIYDPGTGTVLTTGSLTKARHGHDATRLADGRVLITGGFDNSQTAVAETEIYDPGYGTFSSAGYLQIARANHRTVALPNGEALVVGGSSDGVALASTEISDLATSTFAFGPDLNEPRSGSSAIELADGRILFAGGRGASNQLLATVEMYKCSQPPAPVTTSTVLVSSRQSSTYGEPITYTATVSSLAGGDATPQSMVRFVEGDTLLLGEALLDASGSASVTVMTTPAGSRSIRAEYQGSAAFSASTSEPVTAIVAKATATASLTLSPVQRQFSDRVTLIATVSPADAAEKATFKVGPQLVGEASFVDGKATLVAPLLGEIPPGVRFGIAVLESPNYEVANPMRSMNVLKEDARVEYAPPTTVYTCQTCTTATIVLEARVTDISLAEPAGVDVDAGNIGKATVSFVNRATAAVIQTVTVTPDAADPRTGTARYAWLAPLGKSNPQTFTIGRIVANYYMRNSSADDLKVTVVRR